MGGNDTHDKYGRPYELDDGIDRIYDKLEVFREASNAFICELENRLKELASSKKGDSVNDFKLTENILREFFEIFSSCDY